MCIHAYIHTACVRACVRACERACVLDYNVFGMCFAQPNKDGFLSVMRAALLCTLCVCAHSVTLWFVHIALLWS